MNFKFLLQKIDELSKPLLEDFGNLNQLNLGPMIDLVRDNVEQANGKWRSGGSGVANKLNPHSGISSTSEIVDAGILKGGLSGLRKLYKNNPSTMAFVIYINNKAVVFGIFDEHDLAGSSRTGKIAYNFNNISDIFSANLEKRKADHEAEKIAKGRGWDNYGYHDEYEKEPTTQRQSERSKYDDNPNKIRNHIGKSISTGSLKILLERVQEIVSQAGARLTVKLVLQDRAAASKRQNRNSNKRYNVEYSGGLEDLKKRLALYKNSKQPMANNIKEFLSMVVAKAAKKIQFDGRTYSAIAGTNYSYQNISPIHLLNGTKFDIIYKDMAPESYNTKDLTVTYAFDKTTGILGPISASWSATNGKKSQRKEGILDFERWARSQFGGATKQVIIPKLLSLIKDKKFNEVEKNINSMRDYGIDWPEFDVIDKSISIEKKQNDDDDYEY